MIKIFQTVSKFYSSKFDAAVKAMADSCKEPWAQKVSKGQKDQLWALYKQATEGDKEKLGKNTEDKGNFPNMGSPMTSFRAMEGKDTAQGQSEGMNISNMFKGQKQARDDSQQTGQKMDPNSNSATQGLNISRAAQSTSQQGYGNRVDTKMQSQKQDMERDLKWQQIKGKSKQEAQADYIKLARSILQSNKATQYIKEF